MIMDVMIKIVTSHEDRHLRVHPHLAGASFALEPRRKKRAGLGDLVMLKGDAHGPHR